MSQQRLRPEDLKPGPIRHEQLPAALIARIGSVRQVFAEVYPLSMAEWRDGFQRDAHPEQEVQWWERLARCYVEYISQKQLNREQRKAAFSLIFRLGLGASGADLAGDLASLSRGALDEILAIMHQH